MKRLLGLPLAAAAFALTFGLGGNANAAFVVTNNDDAPVAWATADAAAGSVDVPGTWTTAPTQIDPNPPAVEPNVSGVYRSPFDNEDVVGDNTSYIGDSFFVIGPHGTTANSATMTFLVDQNSLSFLWGSVDTYNAISFYLNGGFVETVENTDIAPAPTNAAGKGASYVTISGMAFDEIRFNSTDNALEWSNMSTTPVPIPGAVWLFGSGVLGLLGIGYTRRRRAAA